MKIFCIDSTSYIPRIAIVEDGKCIYETQGIGSGTKWNNMVAGDVSYLIDDFFQIMTKIKKEKGIAVSDCDIICYSGHSGFRSTMNLGKIFAKSLAIQYDLEAICTDHITAHYFSQFTCYEKDKHDTTAEFPILFFSASGSHNSLALLKSYSDLTVLHDETYFDHEEQKYIGLGSIYFKACKICKVLGNDESTDKISKKLLDLPKEYDDILIGEFINAGENTGIFDMNFHAMFFYLKQNIATYEGNYKSEVIFRSFEEAIFRLIENKLSKIFQSIPCRQLSIVGGISQNDDFVHRMQKKFQVSGTIVTRPHADFRFDNASMLGTLTYFMKTYDTVYPVSKIIT